VLRPGSIPLRGPRYPGTGGTRVIPCLEGSVDMSTKALYVPADVKKPVQEIEVVNLQTVKNRDVPDRLLEYFIAERGTDFDIRY
jgi:hypothetical protein